MYAAAVDTWAWVLLYGGLVALSLGVFVHRAHEGLGWIIIGSGAGVALAGIALIIVRSHMRNPEESP